VRFGQLAVEEAVGTVLAHAATGRDGVVFRKGRKLSPADIATLQERGVRRVTAVSLGPDDVTEDQAALEIARAVAGEHLRVADAFTGRVNLHAEASGLLVVDSVAIDAMNQIDESVTVATLPAFAQVTPSQMAATIKIIPFAIKRRLLDACLAHIGAHPPIRVAPYRPLAVRLIQTELPGTAAKMLDKTVTVTTQRLEALGSKLLGERRCPHETGALAAELERTEPADLILIAGASAITDRGDVLPAGLEAAGGDVLHFGMPVDPGNLILLGRLKGTPVLGLPGCARSPKLNGFDWVLQRMTAGIEVTPRDIMRMGVGGLLMEIPTRPQPREKTPVKPSGPSIAAVVLAGGQSRRMGGPNKLLVEVDGKPMVRRAVEAALAARLSPVIVVTGHMREQVEEALAGMPVQFTHNPHFAEGLSTSVRTGFRALSADANAAVVLLGDMPRITGRTVNRLVAAYNPVEGRAVVVPTHHGKRGNPVLWDRAFFADMRELAGDVGAKGLIGRHDDVVAEVELEDDAVLLDIDTPQALAAVTGGAA
jgi:molybdenum cofactor cytidylyltransferase